MIELELMINDLGKILEKEKGLRNKHLLETAVISLKEYEMAISRGDATYVQKRNMQ
ncbi:MAG: hypothetical protein Q7K34_01910 [archaeon]|nr:hypothetical protein [archaeon]